MTKYQKVPEVGQQASLSEPQRITRPDFIDLPMTGLEGPMPEEERALQESVHRFAEEVIRPQPALQGSAAAKVRKGKLTARK